MCLYGGSVYVCSCLCTCEHRFWFDNMDTKLTHVHMGVIPVMYTIMF